jgi:hypothetical protein
MPHQDQGRLVASSTLAGALDGLVGSELFGKLAFRADCRWTPQTLVQATLVWAWGEATTLAERCLAAQETIAPAGGGQRELVSYQAFLKLLQRHSASLLFALIVALQRRMREALGGSYRVAGRLAFGVDGTRLDAPRTMANEQSFGVARCRTRRRGRRRRAARKKAAAPRVWLTALWHLGSGLPWNWQRGPSDSSEREHALKMLDWLPERSLLVADAGFTGYEFWEALQARGHDFLIRVGANVTLLKELGYFRERGGRVYLWPDRQQRRGSPPLVLRLVVAHDGKHPVHLVTNVLTQTALTDRQVIELYQARWGIEVFFRSFKRTFGRHKLLSASPEAVRLELDWSLAALWAACLYAKVQQCQAGEDITRTSVAQVLRILRRAIRQPRLALDLLLTLALIDNYTRASKASRDYPRKKTEAPATAPPIILKANSYQTLRAQQLRRLTA